MRVSYLAAIAIVLVCLIYIIAGSTTPESELIEETGSIRIVESESQIEDTSSEVQNETN